MVEVKHQIFKVALKNMPEDAMILTVKWCIRVMYIITYCSKTYIYKEKMLNYQQNDNSQPLLLSVYKQIILGIYSSIPDPYPESRFGIDVKEGPPQKDDLWSSLFHTRSYRSGMNWNKDPTNPSKKYGMRSPQKSKPTLHAAWQTRKRGISMCHIPF